MDFVILCRYILEGKELEFYQRKIQKKKGKGAA
jgi:small subunit ribosomal protein S8e